MRKTAVVGVGFAVLALWGCGGKTPEPPPPAATPTVPGATVVTGRERLAWSQSGDGTQYSYRLFIDGAGAALAAVQCTVGDAESDCAAPLPAMSDGVHTLELSVLSAGSDLESERSAPFVVQKVSSRAAGSAAQLPDAVTGFTSSVPARTMSGSAETFVAEVIARDVVMPAQLAPLPDGRVLAATGDGRVLAVYPGEPWRTDVALDPSLLNPHPTQALALAVAADVATSRHAFVGYIYRDAAAQPRARVVRLRDVGNRLGEPAAIFDAALVSNVSAGRDASPASEVPRLAFGPDGHLYVALPPGLGFDGQPAASAPLPAMARVTIDGRTPTEGAITGLTAHPLALAWHPSTRQLLGLMPNGSAGAMVRPIGDAPSGAQANLARFSFEGEGAARVLRFDTVTVEGGLDVAALALTAARGWPDGVVRLSVPADLQGLVPGLRGRLEDLASHAGVVYAVVSDEPTGDRGTGATGLIVRLRR